MIRRARLAALGGLIVVLTLAAYSPSVRNGFVNFDDNTYVFENAHVRGGLTAAGVRWAFTSFHAANWHPLTWLSHMLDATVWGMSPAGHHLTSLVLHAANGVLMFAALAVMTGAWWRSLLVAALFAVHPLHVESVAWVAERKDVLSTLFGLLGVVSYARYARGPGWGRYGAVAGCLALSLMSKPMLVTFPFLLLLLDYWPLGRIGTGSKGTGSVERSGTVPVPGLGGAVPGSGGAVPGLGGAVPGLGGAVPGSGGAEMEAGSASMGTGSVERSGTVPVPLSRRWGWLILEKIPLLLLAAASSAVTFLAQSAGGAVKALEDHAPWIRLGNAALSYVNYVRLMLWPEGLSVYYPHPGRNIVWWHAALALAALTGLTWAACRLRRRPYLAIGWLWYLGLLVPVIGLVKIGGQAMADRYTYLPLTGLFIVLVWGAGDLAGRVAGGWAGVAVPAVAVILALARVTYVQTAFWKDSVTLFRRNLDVTGKGNFVALNNLGTILAQEGRMDEAIPVFRLLLDVKPDFAPGYYNMALAMSLKKRIPEALIYYEQALKRNPGYEEALYNLAGLMAELGRDDQAVRYYRKALQVNPANARARNNLGIVLAKNGLREQAVREYRDALKLHPFDAEIHNNLGLVLSDMGLAGEAADSFRAALKLKPDYAAARLNLERVLAAAGDGARGRSKPDDLPPPAAR